ncbi:MAG TPA: amino acid adenylation domain-containing protein, partial [Archangium sp.]|uniref:non-ribosomal peptide synthetase n=1 Tax=Archangium sp. TaxID=1872627 RepID=UPI002E37043C
AGQPVQRIAPDASLPLTLVDLSSLPPSERQAEAHRLAFHSVMRPFDLAHGPLLHASLFKLDERLHILALCMHHIVSDGWSMGIFVREMAALYQAFSSGQPSPLPELPLQYADYAVWQRQWLQGAALEQQLSYWRQQLSGAPASLELPTDKPRPSVQSHSGAHIEVHLSKALSESLKAFCQREGVTPFMALLAAFQLLLSRYSGQDDISVGSPIAGRRHAELEGLIGFFVNTLVLRARLSGVSSFRELLHQVRETTLGAFAHQDIPFEKLVEELRPPRDLSRTPLFQVMFALQNLPTGELQLPGLSLRPVEPESTTARFELSLALNEVPEGFGGTLTYNTDLFDALTAARMMRHFQVLLEAIAARPYTVLRDLPLLPPEERQQVLVEWNDTRTDFPRDATLHSLVRSQALRTPEATALVSESGTLTYRQLSEASTRLALHLRSLGVGPGSLVALCIERSPEMLVSLLAILEAGAAWVPMDPEYPAERLAFMLEDSDATLLVTRSALLQALPATRAQVLRLDSLDALNALPPAPQGTVLPEPEATSPAYVIYTSGSTGRPKGVQVAHRAAVNHLHWRQREFPMSPQDAFLQKASFSFDISVWEMFAPLLAGARLVLARPGGQRDPEYLVRMVMRHGITHLHFGPAPLSVFLQTPDVERCQSLRFVFCGGEPLTHELHALFLSKLSARLVHQYGPTEACIDSTAWVCPPHPVSALPIGRPISNTQAYVVDASLRPVPVGVPGELLIGGEGLALGYLNRPELTSERFITDPFSTTPGARLYRTGDKVRWLADGTLEFLGRLDSQVKLRGFRIELGEVESVLLQHASVRQAVALVREDVPGDRRLVAYVTGDSPDASSLRAFLQQRLPEYMVPSAFVALEALPLTPNGKLDRKALPAPEASNREHERAFLPPRDELELKVARVFEEVLGVQPVGVRGHFFELGGHSLLAVRLMGRLREVTGRGLPLATLFQAPTVEQLAQLLRGEQRAWTPLVPLVPWEKGDPRRPLFVVHPVGGTVIGYSELASQLGPKQPLYALESRGMDGSLPPLTTIEEMATLYVEAIRTLQPSGPYLLGGWSMGGVIAYEMTQQLLRQGEQVEVLMLIDSQVPNGRPAHVTNEEEALQRAFVGLVEEFVGNGFKVPEERVKTLDREELLHVILEEARQANLALPDVGLEQVRALRDVFEANLRASWRYKATAYEGDQLTLLRAAQAAEGQTEDRGWAVLVPASGRLDIHEVPGTHFELLKQPHVQSVAERLRESLERAHERAAVNQRSA